MNITYLSLGSSIGKKTEVIRKAIKDLAANGKVLKTSSFLKTKPEGGVAKNMFLNICVKFQTELTAFQLLKFCNSLEIKHGRIREQRWDDRTLDIDIITFNKEKVSTKDLKIPHPLASQRDFVLKPLAEICDYTITNGKIIIEEKDL